MIRHFWTTFFISFAFITLFLGGYNCAQKQVISSDTLPDVTIPQQNIEESVSRDTSSIPDTPTDTCPRSQYRTLKKRYGALAPLHFKKGNLEDYRLGRSLNFDLGCARLFLSMTKISSSGTYKGKLRIAYTDTGSSGGTVIKVQEYHTGTTVHDTKFNDWDGSWNRMDRHGVVDARFVAIFEDKSFGAIILHINKAVRFNITDGEGELEGYGDLWFKPFRTYDGNRQDHCYSSGTFVSQAKHIPPQSSLRCWHIANGPYSCRPNGVGSPDLENQLDPETSDLEPECYLKLGEFGRLDIREAFNLDSDEDHP